MNNNEEKRGSGRDLSCDTLILIRSRTFFLSPLLLFFFFFLLQTPLSFMTVTSRGINRGQKSLWRSVSLPAFAEPIHTVRSSWTKIHQLQLGSASGVSQGLKRLRLGSSPSLLIPERAALSPGYDNENGHTR